MESFKDFMNEEGNKTYGYVSVTPNTKTKHLINNIIKDSKLQNTIPINELHMTLAYDENNPLTTIKVGEDADILGTFCKFKILGNALVMILNEQCGLARWNELKEEGFAFDYDTFTPHISLKYNVNETDLKMVNKVLVDYQLSQVVLGEEKWEYCDV